MKCGRCFSGALVLCELEKEGFPSVYAQGEAEPRRVLERDLEEEQGGCGVYSVDLRSMSPLVKRPIRLTEAQFCLRCL